MKRRETILVVGGAGFIGSHVNKMLHQRGFQTIVLDDLSRGTRQMVQEGTFIQGNLGDREVLHRIFQNYPIDAVMHFAALTDVGESIVEPLKYYTHNVMFTLTLLESMRQHGIRRLIFSSSAAIFGLPQQEGISETHPCQPINPYGESKLMVETILRRADEVYGIKSCCLRYFNAAGGDPEGKRKNFNFQRKENNLIPIILKNLKNSNPAITINGTDYSTPDGTCVRDYIHIEDIGEAHIAAMEKLFEGSSSTHYNLGNGRGFSVREIISAASRVTGCNINVIEGPRRAGDPPVLVADAQKAFRELGWKPRYPSVETMISHAWQALDLEKK